MIRKINLKYLLNQAEMHSINKRPVLVHKEYNVNDFIDEALKAEDINNVHTLGIKVRRYFGFSFFSSYIYIPRAYANPLCYLMRDYTDAWSEHYLDQNYLYVDPSVCLALIRTTPSAFKFEPQNWHELKHIHFDRRKSNQDIIHQSQAEKIMAKSAYVHGIRDVIAFPFNGAQGDHGVIKFVNTQNGPQTKFFQQFLVNNIASLTLVANYLYEAIIRTITTHEYTEDIKPLSDRESDVLCWAAMGKSSSEIGKLLSISENTVQTYFKNIHIKLQVQTRQHAIAKAVSLKLISI